MSEVRVRRGDPREVGATALLQQSHALMQSLFPAEACNYLDIGDLCVPDIRFYLAELDDRIVGCVALAIRAEFGEVKSMFVEPEQRGGGIADALLAHIEQDARDLSMPLMMLETGTLLKPALRFYERNGYSYRGPFGGYQPTDLSLYMEKAL